MPRPGGGQDFLGHKLISGLSLEVKTHMKLLRLLIWVLVLQSFSVAGQTNQARAFEVVVVGGTPGGIMAAVAAARLGRNVVLLERTAHVGGLPANGLGATDIATRGATGGLFAEFVGRVRAHYVQTYGENSPQVKDCDDGYHFEPRVAEKIFQDLLAEHPRVTVLLHRQFEALPANVKLEEQRLTQIEVTNRESGATESFRGRVFIDATYEGDLAAAAGAPYRLGREGFSEHQEPRAGRLYMEWRGIIGTGSTGLADNAVQSYNYRLALTRVPANRVAIAKPPTYSRDEYVSLIDDLRLNRVPAPKDAPRREIAFDGVGRLVNMVTLPNGKTDANNQHAAFLSTDLPEENWPWPTSEWQWRDRFAARLRDYTLGLLWFAQNDPALPEDFRRRAAEWGLAKDEYTDNGHFPRQVYVREGRRIMGEHLFTAHDAIPVNNQARPPLHASSITASHYALDSHAVRKREAERVHLDGFFSHPSKPYTVPYGVIVPLKVEGLLVPVPASATHIGFSTLRMEPCWMALGQAAGVAAGLSIEKKVPVRKVAPGDLQATLLQQKAVLIYYSDVPATHPHFVAVQHFGLRGWLPDWQARPDDAVEEQDAARWITAHGGQRPSAYQPGKTTRGELLGLLYQIRR